MINIQKSIVETTLRLDSHLYWTNTLTDNIYTIFFKPTT